MPFLLLLADRVLSQGMFTATLHGLAAWEGSGKWELKLNPTNDRKETFGYVHFKDFEIICFVGVDFLEPVSSEVFVWNGSLEMIF